MKVVKGIERLRICQVVGVLAWRRNIQSELLKS